MKQLLCSCWSKSLHRYVGEPVKSAVVTVLLCQKVRKSLSKDVCAIIFEFLAQSWPLEQILEILKK